MRHLRARIAGLILCVVLLMGMICPAAAESPADQTAGNAVRELFIALDDNITDESYSAAYEFLMPLATFAHGAGTPVHVLDVARANKGAELYPGDSANAGRPGDAFARVQKVSQSSVAQGPVTVAENLRDLLSGKAGDLFVFNRFTRLHEADDAASVTKFLNAMEALLQNNPDLTVRLIWASQKDATTGYADEKLQSAYPGRVTSMTFDAGMDAAVGARLLVGQFNAEIAFRQDGPSTVVKEQTQTVTIPYKHNGDYDALLCMTFDETKPLPVTAAELVVDAEQAAETTVVPWTWTKTLRRRTTVEPSADPTVEPTVDPMVDPTVETTADPTAGLTADAEPGAGEIAPPRAAAGIAHIDRANRRVWVYLRDAARGDYNFALTYEGAEAPVPNAITTYRVGFAPTLRLDAGEGAALTWNKDERKLALYADLAFIPAGQLTAVLTIGPAARAATEAAPVATAEPMSELPLPGATAEPMTELPLPGAVESTLDEEATGGEESEQIATPTTWIVQDDGAVTAEDATLAAANAGSGVSRYAPSGDPVKVGDDYRWEFTVPEEALRAFSPDEQELIVSASITLKAGAGVTLEAEPMAVTLDNRGPEPVQGAAYSLNVYSDVPGAPTSQSIFNLNDYFKDPDGDPLTFAAQLAGAQDNGKVQVDARTGSMTYSPVQIDGENELVTAFTVTATDPYGKSAQAQFEIRQQSILNILNGLRMRPVRINGEAAGQPLVGRIGENTLEFQLDGEAFAAYAAATGNSLESALTVKNTTAERAECALSTDADGNLLLTVDLGERLVSATIDLAFSATLTATGTPLENLIAPVQVTIGNDGPRLSPTAVLPEKKSIGMAGRPGHYESITFEQIFGAVRLTDLFVDSETDAAELTYIIAIEGAGRMSDPDMTPVPGEDGMPVYELSGGQDLSGIQFTAPGDIKVTVRAKDSEFTSNDSVVYEAKISSNFTRTLVTIIIVAAALLACAIVAFILYRKSLPSFADAQVWIAYDYARPVQQWNAQTASTLALSSYGKDRVSLLTLLIASAHMLPRGISPEALGDVGIIPGKHGTYSVALGGQAVSEGLQIRVDGGVADKKTQSVNLNQVVDILSQNGHVTLCVTQGR